MRQKKQLQGFGTIVIILILLVVVTIGFFGWKAYQQLRNQKQNSQKVIKKQVLVRRSKIPNVITQATTAKAVDAKTGKVITPASVFFPNDKTIYLALGLNKPKVGTRIDYLRYFNGRYVDHGSVKIAQPNTSHLAFDWSVTHGLGNRPDGQYKVATYTNGVLEKRILYTVEKNKLSFL